MSQLAHEDYISLTKRCKSEMEQIVKLEGKADRSEAEENELICVKQRFSIIICADYQMSKLLPHWLNQVQPTIYRS